MLDTADLSKKMPKNEYDANITPLKERLSVLQHEVKASKLPVIVVFEGWSAAGKGTILSDVILTLDPRSFKAISTQPPTAEEQRKPFLWRHWCSIPPEGRIMLYDKSWYHEMMGTLHTKKQSKAQAASQIESIQIFEKQMADSGALIIKFFLHISQKEQKKRLDKLASKKSTSWRVDKGDYRCNKEYDGLYSQYNDMLLSTNQSHAPWHVIGCHDYSAALAQVYQILVDSITSALEVRNSHTSKTTHTKKEPLLTAGDFTLLRMPSLSEVAFTSTCEEDYNKQLHHAQNKLKKLHNYIYLNKIPLVIGYEGWDAAGKGGNIRRLAAALDPRGYEVIPIASPTPPEKERQYLWRFWQNLPKDGHITIFDRTWYGRVMVERVEGFAAPEEWQRAYREINEFEYELHKWGAIILKFWLHISKEEQLRRFEDRQNTPSKQWKITDEDWRNREKWDAYEVAVNDMLRLTSTDFAPWTIVESEDKKVARIKVLETVIAAIEERL